MFRSAPQPMCSCSKEDLLRDIPGSKVTDKCPICLSAGCDVLVAFHPSEVALKRANAAAPLADAATSSAAAPSDARRNLAVDATSSSLAPSPSSPAAPVTTEGQTNSQATGTNPADGAVSNPADGQAPPESGSVGSKEKPESDASADPSFVSVTKPAHATSPEPAKKVSDGYAENVKCQGGYLYTGTVRDGSASGYGVRVKPGTLSCYKGQWVANRREGHGRQVEEDGTAYEGGYLQGRRHGRGRLFDKLGRQTVEGTWKEGVLIYVEMTEEEKAAAMRAPAMIPQYSTDRSSQVAPHVHAPPPPYGRQVADSTVYVQPRGQAFNQNQTQVNVHIAGPRERTNHACHCLLFTFLGGLWLPCWIAACCDCACQHPCNS